MAALLREENGRPAAGGRKMAALQLKGLGMAALQLGEENGRPAAGGWGREKMAAYSRWEQNGRPVTAEMELKFVFLLC